MLTRRVVVCLERQSRRTDDGTRQAAAHVQRGGDFAEVGPADLGSGEMHARTLAQCVVRHARGA